MKFNLSLIFILIMFCMLFQSCNKVNVVSKNAIVDANIEYQTIDGFGVNFNPALWNGGQQKEAIDLLADNLGADQFRFDCYGFANWLDPSLQMDNGKWSQSYLDSVYSSSDWKDAWEAFRYLNSKNIVPYFNISGVVPQEWNEPNTKILKNFDAYAEMIATMLDWARNKENLEFKFVDPFNETDFNGSREGPAIPSQNRIKAVASVVKKLKEYKLNDVKLIVFSDGVISNESVEPFLKDTSFVNDIYAFSGHTYGNGDEGEGGWYWGHSQMGYLKEMVLKTPYKNAHFWVNEFGDLDQTNEIEFEFAWRTFRRLLLEMRSGTQSCQFWDGFDNYHKHDSAWTTFGLLKTDSIGSYYKPKTRFYALKHIYRFVKPGFIRMDISDPKTNKYSVHKMWKSGLKNIKIYAFKSPDEKEITIVGMNLVESDVKLIISIKGMSLEDGGKVSTYITSRNNNCVRSSITEIKDNSISTIIPERSIFTISTLKADN